MKGRLTMGYTIWPDGYGGDVLSMIHRERHRQDELKRSGKFHWTCADLKDREGVSGIVISDEAKLAVLAEEFGEVSKLVVEGIIDPIDRRDVDVLCTELVQVAAVAAAWAEALLREKVESNRKAGRLTGDEVKR